MFKLDNAFLEELGLGTLPPVEKNKMLAHIYETLEMRVGVRLAEQMSNEQLSEFEGYVNQKDEAGALRWLETNFPDYKQVVAQELDKLKNEIREVAPQIVAQAQQAEQQTSGAINNPPTQTNQTSQQQGFQPQEQPQQPYSGPQTPPDGSLS
jgi:predicted RNA-binding Zn ribbon-like protein